MKETSGCMSEDPKMAEKQESILVVDDEQTIRAFLKQVLRGEGYRCEEAGNAAEALEKLEGDAISLVLLDIKMPGRSGLELLPEIRASFPDTAVVMATAMNDTSVAVQCMKQGAYDYVAKPFGLEDVVLSVERALQRRRLELENRVYQQHLEELVSEKTKELREALDRIKLASLDTIYRLARAAEYRDADTGAHIERIGRSSAAIARQLGLENGEVDNMLYAAPMHDVGKIAVPDRILLNPGSLSAEEWEIMKKHTTIGSEILQGSDADFIRLAEVIALTHHEKWDGSGYPRGLRGSQIPLAGRIVAIADVFDALTSARPYKEPFPVTESLDIVRKQSGVHFDPDVVDAFFVVQDEISAIRDEHRDEEESRLRRMVAEFQHAH
ncbi:MAG: response regulator [Dehalococcoidia bacterium]